MQANAGIAPFGFPAALGLEFRVVVGVAVLSVRVRAVGCCGQGFQA